MKRDTYNYVLKEGNKILYAGITKDLERRETEHQKDKVFNKMTVIGRASTLESAKKRETEMINRYMKNHGGKLPKYNDTKTGK